jgi:hypothetical protein
MFTFEGLPLEVVGEILIGLDSLDSLNSCIRASPKALAAFREISRIEATILYNNIPTELLPYALALVAIERLDRWRIDLVEETIHDIHERPEVLVSRLLSPKGGQAFDRRDIRKIRRKNIEIQNMAFELTMNFPEVMTLYSRNGVRGLVNLFSSHDPRILLPLYQEEIIQSLEPFHISFMSELRIRDDFVDRFDRQETNDYFRVNHYRDRMRENARSNGVSTCDTKTR